MNQQRQRKKSDPSTSSLKQISKSVFCSESYPSLLLSLYILPPAMWSEGAAVKVNPAHTAAGEQSWSQHPDVKVHCWVYKVCRGNGDVQYVHTAAMLHLSLSKEGVINYFEHKLLFTRC